MSNYESNEEINIFREYLRIPSVHPNINYEPCVLFLERQATRLNVPFAVYYPAGPTKPIVVLTWIGSEPHLSSIILNSHMDVVPVFAEHWTHPPFGAEIDNEGRIYARGAQDMKSVGMQYLSAVYNLKLSNTINKRTVHIVFVPDEEIGGENGMMQFVKSDEFKTLNVGFSLDEGLASPTDEISLYYAERTVWRIQFKCNGTTGHGSLLHTNTAAEKFRYIIEKFLDYRENEVLKMKNNNLDIGQVTTVNLTMVDGGVQPNVVPPTLTLTFDVRIALDVDHQQFEEMLKKWCTEAGGDVDINFLTKKPKVPATVIDNSNAFWTAFKGATDELNLNIKPLVFPGRTDSCFIRELGIPALGFSPMNHTPVLLHDNDEFISAEIFLKGIEIYKKIIVNLANV